MRKLFILIAIILAVSFNPFPALAQFFNVGMENPLTGKNAPEFNLPTLSGKKMNLTQYRAGKSAIVFFWATWCPNCYEKLVELSKDAGELKNKQIQVILVDIGENTKTVESYMKKNHVPYDVFLDEESKISENYGIIGIPTLFFVGKDGIIKAVEHSLPKNYTKILNQ